MPIVKPRWSEMTTEDFAHCVDGKSVAVLPIAATEQHGPHLPVGVDSYLGRVLVEETIRRLPEDLPVTFLPLQPVGKSTEHEDYPGTLSLSAETALRLWMEIGESVHRTGVKKLVIFNAHGGNVGAMDIVGRDLHVKTGMMVVGLSWFEYGLPADSYDEDEENYGWHGGAIETAMMMAAYPDLVREGKRDDFVSRALMENDKSFFNPGRAGRFYWKARDLHDSGTTGDAGAATPDKGQAIIDHTVNGFLGLLREISDYPYARDKGLMTSGRWWAGTVLSSGLFLC